MKNIVKRIRIVFLIMLLGALDLSACTNAVNDTNLVASFAEKNQSIETESFAPAEAEVKQIESDPMQWNVYISDDVPEHFIEVLKQYESFMNAENQDLNDESVRNKLEGGEWQYLYIELCGAWQSVLEREGAEIATDAFCYSLADLTGDGDLELVMGQGNSPCVIYYYSDKDGIRMECTSIYYTMYWMWEYCLSFIRKHRLMICQRCAGSILKSIKSMLVKARLKLTFRVRPVLNRVTYIAETSRVSSFRTLLS